jgi:hypothetical protein
MTRSPRSTGAVPGETTRRLATMPSMTTWSDVDEPLLRWLLDREATDDMYREIIKLTLRTDPEPEPEFGPGLDSGQVDDGLRRLRDHRLIEGERGETIGYAIWSKLRLRAEGLIVLGEWPDLERVASFTGVQTLVATLAEQTADPDDRRALRQTAGAIARLGEGIFESTIGSVATDAVEGL